MPPELLPDSFDVFACDSQNGTVRNGAGAADQGGTSLDRSLPDFIKASSRVLAHRRAEEQEHGQTIKASGLMRLS
jgi:hypothetical protein